MQALESNMSLVIKSVQTIRLSHQFGDIFCHPADYARSPFDHVPNFN
jgi:hypothetical protein